MADGEAKKISSSPTGVQQFAWSHNESSLAFVQEDELPNKSDIEKGYDAFEIKYKSMYLKAKQNPAHNWLISSYCSDFRVALPNSTRYLTIKNLVPSQ